MFRFPADVRAYQARGFTLVELMTVVAVVAILSTIAMSSYSNYVLRTNRTEGRLALLAIQVAQEKFFLQNNAYAQDLLTVITPSPVGLGISTLDSSGVTPGGKYTISFDPAFTSANTYKLKADATGAQTHDTAACLTFTIDDKGTKTPLDSSGCWK